jgi:GR25 family glycosyltransferase involved in LPS biosynthesis
MKEYIRPEAWEQFNFEHVWKVYKRHVVGTDAGKMSRPGVIGCFYSHYSLWKKCVELDKPIMIFEDDVKFYREWYPVDWEGVLILSLGKSSFYNEPYKTFLENPSGAPQPMPWRQFSMPGASGYAIKPDAALGLIKSYKSYFYPADNAINKSICTLQIHNYLMGRNTLPEEGNISMTRAKIQ